MKYGLTEQQLAEVIAFIKRHPEVEEAVLFGSRAMDTYKEASDIDIAIKGEKVSSELAATIKFELEEDTYLPFFFDVIAYPTITNKALIEHIDTKGVKLFGGDDLGEWLNTTLGNLTTLHYGKALKVENRSDGLIPVYSSAGLTGSHNQALINDKGIIVGRKGTVGKAYLSNGPFWCIDTAYFILPDEDRYVFKFLFYLLRTLGLEELNEDSAVPGLNRDTAYQQPLLLPPLPEQKAIAKVLSSLDDKIDLLHRQNKTLEAMAETLFRQWFIEEASEDWEKTTLSTILSDIESGIRPKGGIDANLVCGIASIGAESINGIGSFDFKKTKYVSDEFFLSMKNGVVVDYDVLIYKDGAYIGKKAMFGLGFPFKYFAVNEHVFILRGNEKINQFFLYFLLEQEELSLLNTNSAQPGINQASMKSLQITLPPFQKIQNFGNTVKPWVDKILRNANQIQTLEKLRDTLLPKLMNGEVRVAYDRKDAA